MKKANSETEFDLSDFTCPFLDGECQKDCCTHFERFDGGYESFRYKEEWNSAICHAGHYVQLWYEFKKTEKPHPKRNWIQQIIDIIVGPRC